MNLEVARLFQVATRDVARVEEDRKVLDDLPTLVAAARRGKAEDAQDQFVMAHRVRKSVSSAVRLIIGHVTVRRWMMVLHMQRSEILDLTPMVIGLAICIPRNSRVENYSNRLDDSMCLDFLCGAATSPVQDEDQCEAHAAYLVEAEGFRVLDCGATTSFGSAEGAEALFSKINENDTRIPDVDLCGCSSFNFGDGASSKAASLSRLPVRNEALGDFGVTVHLFSDQPKPTTLMRGMDFRKEHLCVVNYGEDSVQFLLQFECWWPLLVWSRGLYSMPLCGLPREPSSQTQKQLSPQGMCVWFFLMVTCSHQTMTLTTQPMNQLL